MSARPPPLPTDAERWDAKYARAAPCRAFSPDPLLEQVRLRLRDHSRRVGGGRMLDLACGRGDNAILGAMCGFSATGIDISPVGLSLAQANAARFGLALEWTAADLDSFRLTPASFDAVAVFRYLNRKLFDGLIDCLRPGGLLVYKTFNLAHLERNPGFSEDFVLQPGELRQRFDALRLVASNETEGGLPQRDTSSHIVAIKAV